MKSMLIKSLLLILLITIAVSVPNNAYAMDDVISQGEGFLEARNNTLPINEDALESTSDYVYNILFTIAVVLAIAIGMIIGIQFMMGSVEEQAKVKETLVPYVIGVFIVFASFTIWKIVVEIGDDISPTPEARPEYTYTDISDIQTHLDNGGTLDELSNETIKRAYQSAQNLMGPWTPQQSSLITQIENEYKSRFGSS